MPTTYEASNTCQQCGHVGTKMIHEEDGQPPPKEGETAWCSRCGAGYTIVPDGLKLIGKAEKL